AACWRLSEEREKGKGLQALRRRSRAREGGQGMLRIGAFAYAPYVVTIFEGLKRHFHRQGVELDWVLYSSWDALVTAFVTGEVDLAWNGPLAYVKIRRALVEPC